MKNNQQNINNSICDGINIKLGINGIIKFGNQKEEIKFLKAPGGRSFGRFRWWEVCWNDFLDLKNQEKNKFLAAAGH